MAVKGIKVFNEDWTCKDKEYHCPGIFKENIDKDNLKVRSNGMHFCKKGADCFDYYDFNPRKHVCEVEALGDIDEDGNMCCTNKLKVIREIPWEEVLTIVNIGRFNTGKDNTGDFNSGDFNTGNYNSGRFNTGDFNSGSSNSGRFNTGDFNSGYFNNGNFNSGDFNNTDGCSGVFCTTLDKIRMFNKLSNWTLRDWYNTRAYKILCFIPGEEKVKMADDYEYSRQTWWNELPERDKNAILELPNFDKNIFREITGIDVESVKESEE